MADVATLKEAFRQACANGDYVDVRQTLDDYLPHRTGVATVEFIATQLARASDSLDLPGSKIAVLSSFTSATLEPHLRIHEFQAGFDLKFLSIPYQQWHGALTTGDELDDFQGDFLLLALHLEDVAPILAHRHLAASDQIEIESELLIAAIAESLSAFRQRSSARVIVCNFIDAERGVEKHFDRTADISKHANIENLNLKLAELTRHHADVFLFDYAQAVADFGRLNWFDIVKGHQFGTVLTTNAQFHLARELVEFIDCIRTPRAKVLVADLDNTLWGGIVGEDGPAGISYSGDFPGNAFDEFQSFLANLRASGIALALASKNNLDDVLEVFQDNTDIRLAWDDFTAARIDWNGKPENIAAIAAEINVGENALTFIDDSPFECSYVETELPDVRVINLSGPASGFRRQVLEKGRFHTAVLTHEDAGRAQGYQAERKRKSAEDVAGDTDSFLASLALSLEYGEPTQSELDRVVQLFGKTNQFNLTTKRNTRADIQRYLDDPLAGVRVAKLEDRFGHYGLIGVVVTLDDGQKNRRIDSFLLSCRALGRSVENAVLAAVDLESRGDGVSSLTGVYTATKKNAQVAEFYARNGFAATNLPENFVRILQDQEALPMPKHIKFISRSSL
jgi:FkbH-like protein